MNYSKFIIITRKLEYHAMRKAYATHAFYVIFKSVEVCVNFQHEWKVELAFFRRQRTYHVGNKTPFYDVRQLCVRFLRLGTLLFCLIFAVCLLSRLQRGDSNTQFTTVLSACLHYYWREIQYVHRFVSISHPHFRGYSLRKRKLMCALENVCVVGPAILYALI